MNRTTGVSREFHADVTVRRTERTRRKRRMNVAMGLQFKTG